MKYRMILAVAAFVVFSPMAPAATDATGDPHLAAAIALLDVTNARANMVSIIDSLSPIVLGQVRRQYPNAKDSVLKAFESALHDEFADSMDDMMKLTAKVYAEHFSEEELRKLAEFYGTEIGKKYIAEVPLIMKETAPIGALWGQQVGARAAQRALDRLKQNGQSL